MLIGEGIFLRTIEEKDVDLILSWENNPANWEVSNTKEPFTRKQIEDYVNSVQDIYIAKQIRFLICDKSDNRPIGTIDLFEYDEINQRVGVGILIEKVEDRNKGYAYNALELVNKYCFEVLLVHQIYCNIIEGNEASIKLFTKTGFKKTGDKKDWLKTSNGWKNVLVYQLLNS